MVRIHCTLENAAEVISGVAFAPHPESGVMTSEPVTDEVADRFCSVGGYGRVASLNRADADAIDDVIARRRELAVAGVAAEVSTASRTIQELENANRAQAADLTRLNDKVANLERVKSPDAVIVLQGEVDRLKLELATAQATSAGTGEVAAAALTQANEKLTQDVADRATAIEGLKRELADKATAIAKLEKDVADKDKALAEKDAAIAKLEKAAKK